MVYTTWGLSDVSHGGSHGSQVAQLERNDSQMRGNTIRTCSHVVYRYRAGMPTTSLTSTHIDAEQHTAHCLIVCIIYGVRRAASGSPVEVQDLIRNWRYGPKRDLPFRQLKYSQLFSHKSLRQVLARRYELFEVSGGTQDAKDSRPQL